MADDPSHSMVPVPDPTVLTTENLRREIDSLRVQMEAKISGLQAILETRITAMDAAAKLLDVPALIEKQINHLQALYDEKFSSIQRQFQERDVRTDQAAIATKIAVDAALQAQKEAAGAQNEANAAAITKSEAATVKQIDGLQALISSNSDATNDRIADLKSRLDRGEGISRGGTDTRVEHRSDTASAIGYIMLAVGIASVVVAVIAMVVTRHG